MRRIPRSRVLRLLLVIGAVVATLRGAAARNDGAAETIDPATTVEGVGGEDAAAGVLPLTE